MMEVLAAKPSGGADTQSLNTQKVDVERRRLMLDRVKSALRSEDRIPLLTTDLWLTHVKDSETERQSVKALQLGESLQTANETFIVDIAVQATTAQAVSKRRSVR